MANSSAARHAEVDQHSSALPRVAQYVRMSTEHQQYSIANQSAAIGLYAAAHGLGIVRAFVDEGKSGTSIKGRRGLQELLRIVVSGSADFSEVLVYDVSRWGRFLDSDEAAHYEYLCKKAGISVRYCAEQFENDNSTTSNLLKALKRTIAGEYSRELSVKVSEGQRRLASLGFWQGGNAPFGTMRQIVDQTGKPKGLLGFGEWKSISTDHTVLTPGPQEAVNTIRHAFDLYTKTMMARKEIVRMLNNARQFRGQSPWTLRRLTYLLKNPIYKGTYAYCKHDQKFRTYKNVPPEQWIIREHAFRRIISDRQFSEASERLRKETKPLIRSVMLDALRRLWRRKGKLTCTLINEARDIPSSTAYDNHFGGINEAYKLIGYPLRREHSFVGAVRMTRQMRGMLCDDICERIRAVSGTAERLSPDGRLLLNQNVTVKVFISKGWVRPNRNTVWRLLLARQPAADLVIVARLNPATRSIFDYFVIPACSELRRDLNARAKDNDAFLEIYRCDDLESFIHSFRRYPIPDAA